jgi:hypothetical protein
MCAPPPENSPKQLYRASTSDYAVCRVMLGPVSPSLYELLARGGLYASMWNRQREAEAAREKLARIEDEAAAPNRNPPPVEDALVRADAAE